MNKDQLTRPSHLFTVRVWRTRLDDGRTEWRGQVQHVLSGERYYFRDWASLITHLLSMLQDDGEV